METSNHIAFDLGASSGRLILGKYRDKKIELEEIYRFANTPVEMNGILYWDFPKLFQEMKYGMKMLANKHININSLSIDTWGVDYGYIDKNGDLLLLPKNYRNPQKNNLKNKYMRLFPEKIYLRKQGFILILLIQLYKFILIYNFVHG